jgi:ABC-type multidrug transport system ATPase subunit
MTSSIEAAAPPTPAPGLTASGLSLAFPSRDRLFQPISFEVRSGQVLVITGINGVGKSTLLGHLADTVSGRASRVREVSGTVSVAGSRSIWHIVSGRLFSGITVEEHLRLVELGCSGTPEGLEPHLHRWGLDSLRIQRVEHLSGGERQRVELAMASASGAEIVVIDEPLRGLDVATCGTFGKSLRELVGTGRVVIIAEHRMDALRACVGSGFDLHAIELISATKGKVQSP